ncbi:putative holin-like toxin [Domibacillus sp. PGB-M46]|uniref:putative holin-like toxin n=1 Tax=Domibacillus sp. PGB-M46 TaxID=2910255 RepID=UPI0035C9420E
MFRFRYLYLPALCYNKSALELCLKGGQHSLIGLQTKSADSWGNVCTTCPAQARGVLPMTTFQSLMLMIAFASLVVSIISLTQKK